MMFLAWGYIIAANFLSFSNYLPNDFFTPTEEKKKNDNSSRNRKSTSFIESRNGNETAGLDYVHIIHSDNTESRYYIKR